MNSIRIIAVGSVKEDFYRAKINYFLKEMNKCYKTELVELKDESIPQNAGKALHAEIINREGDRILGHIQNNDYVVCLCIEGLATDSDKLKKLISSCRESCTGSMVFVIGGSLGLSERVTKRANYKMSFSRMTFPHQLMRVMLLEQLDLNM